MISVQCKKMINEHIPKHQVSDGKVKGCTKPRKEDESLGRKHAKLNE